MIRRLLFPLLATTLFAAVIALMLEIAVRTIIDDGMQYDLEMWKYARDVKRLSADPAIGHEHAPNRQALLMGAKVRTNSRGLRDRDFPYERTPGVTRIVMLGDSLTFGWGVEETETFSKRVEELYRAAGTAAEVINTGVGNYNTGQQVTFFLTEGHKYRPDVVVLNYFVNDAEPPPAHKPPHALARHCYACNFISGRIDTLARKFASRMSFEDYYLSLYGGGDAPGWILARDNILKLAAFCRSNGIRLIVASLPELHDVRDYRFHTVTDLVRQTAERAGIEFTDVLPYLKNERSADLWVTPPDPHPNARAHRLIADALYAALTALPQAAKGLLSAPAAR